MPNVLDHQRPRLEGAVESASSDTDRLQLIEAQFAKACDYGQALWRELDLVRHQLVAMLPDVDADDDARRFLAAPRGPDDDEGWDTWRSLYAGVTSALAGPRGDSGFGRQEAAQEAQRRRGVLHAGSRTADLARQAAEAAAQVEASRSAGYVVEPGALDRDTPPPTRDTPPAAAPATRSPAVVAAVAAVVTGAVGWFVGRRSSRAVS